MVKVGQIVYLGNKFYKAIREVKVSKVGKKFFEVEGINQTRFFIDKMHDDYEYGSPSWRVYTSLQEIEDEKDRQRLTNYLREQFGPYGSFKLNLDQMRRIEVIIKEGDMNAYS